MALTREQILAINDAQTESIDCPEWGDNIFIRVMSGTERDRFEALHVKDPTKDFRARLAVATVCDSVGQLLFSHDDIDAVSAKSSVVLDRIFSKAVKLNGISSQDVDELGKTSPPTP